MSGRCAPRSARSGSARHRMFVGCGRGSGTDRQSTGSFAAHLGAHAGLIRGISGVYPLKAILEIADLGFAAGVSFRVHRKDQTRSDEGDVAVVAMLPTASTFAPHHRWRRGASGRVDMRDRQFDQETDEAGQLQKAKSDHQNDKEWIHLPSSAVETAP